MISRFIPRRKCKAQEEARRRLGARLAEEKPGGSGYLILESEMSNSRCIRCRSVPWFSFRLVVTAARNGFLASKGLMGRKEVSDLLGTC